MSMRSDKSQALINNGMQRFSTFAIVMILLCGLLFCSLGNSGELDQADAGLKIIRECIRASSDLINKWNNHWRIMVALVGTIGILGVVTSLIQGGQGKWVKNMTLCVGGIISTLTVVNNTVFDVDHRTLSKMINKASNASIDLKNFEYQYLKATTEEKRNQLVTQSTAKLNDIQDLSSQSITNSTTAALGLSSWAFAGTSLGHAGPPGPPPPPPPPLPRWVTTVPSDKEHFYFRGMGESSDLQKAAELSSQDAIGRAVEYFSLQFERSQVSKTLNLNHLDLAEYLVESSLSKNPPTYRSYQPDGDTYRYYILLVLDRKILALNLRSFGFQNKIDIPTRLSNTIVNAAQPSQ